MMRRYRMIDMLLFGATMMIAGAVIVLALHVPTTTDNTTRDMMIDDTRAQVAQIWRAVGEHEGWITRVWRACTPVNTGGGVWQCANPTTTQRINEDDPTWNCATMGNHICGRR